MKVQHKMIILRYAKIRDDKYGSGLDFSNTHLIINNNDTLAFYYSPEEEKIFYQLSDKDSLNGEINVKILLRIISRILQQSLLILT